MRRLVLLIPFVLAMTACTSYRSVTVTVRDGGSREPVADARVQVRPVHIFYPDYPYTHWPVRHKGDSAITDSGGLATLEAPARHAFELFVFVPWESPRSVTIEDLPSGAPPWLALIPGGDQETDARTLEVRVE